MYECRYENSGLNVYEQEWFPTSPARPFPAVLYRTFYAVIRCSGKTKKLQSYMYSNGITGCTKSDFSGHGVACSELCTFSGTVCKVNQFGVSNGTLLVYSTSNRLKTRISRLLAYILKSMINCYLIKGYRRCSGKTGISPSIIYNIILYFIHLFIKKKENTPYPSISRKNSDFQSYKYLNA